MVNASPFFYRAETPDVLDTVIWMLPPLISQLLLPVVSSRLSKKVRASSASRKHLLLQFTTLGLLGVSLMAASRFISINLVEVFASVKGTMLCVALIGFILMDVALDGVSLVATTYSNDSLREEDKRYCQELFTVYSSAGKLIAFAVSAIVTFDDEIKDMQHFLDNMVISYEIATVLFFCALGIMLYAFRSRECETNMKIGYSSPVQYETEGDVKVECSADAVEYSLESLFPDYKSFGQAVVMILPIFILFDSYLDKSSVWMNLSHFMMCGNLLLINIYATLWMGQSISQMSKQKEQIESREYWFDLGVGWGALSLSGGAVGYFLASRVLLRIESASGQHVFLACSNLVLNSLCAVNYFTKSVFACTFSLIVWGFAQCAFDAVPGRLCMDLERKKGIPSTMSANRLSISTFACQICFWFIMPAVFLLGADDISVSLLQGSFLGIAGSILALFVH